jgi:hypothetical protein
VTYANEKIYDKRERVSAGFALTLTSRVRSASVSKRLSRCGFGAWALGFFGVFMTGKHPRKESESFLETIWAYAKLFAVKAKELDEDLR